MKGFTLLEMVVALLIAAFLLLTIKRAQFMAISSLERNPSLVTLLVSEGLKRQIENLSSNQFLYQGKRVSRFFLWKESLLAFVTNWSPLGATMVCYKLKEGKWIYIEISLTDKKISEDLCSKKGIILPISKISFLKNDEEVSEILPKDHGIYTLHLEGPSYQREWKFRL